jgi:hypothetical protein
MQVPRARGDVEDGPLRAVRRPDERPVQGGRARQRRAVLDIGEQRDAQELQTASEAGVHDRVVHVAHQPDARLGIGHQHARGRGGSRGPGQPDLQPAGSDVGQFDLVVDVAVAVGVDDDVAAGEVDRHLGVRHLDGEEPCDARPQHRPARPLRGCIPTRSRCQDGRSGGIASEHEPSSNAGPPGGAVTDERDDHRVSPATQAGQRRDHRLGGVLHPQSHGDDQLAPVRSSHGRRATARGAQLPPRGR